MPSRLASLLPKASRFSTYSCAISMQRLAKPSQRMQCVNRAGPSRICVTRKPSPTLSRIFSSGISSPSYSISQWPPCSWPHDRDAAQDAPAGLVLVIEERGQAAARLVRGARHQDEMRGAFGAGDEPFVAGDDIAVALFHGARQHHAGIGARAGMRFGHGEGRAHLAVDERL